MLSRKHYKAIASIIAKRVNLNHGTRRTPKFLYADDLTGDLADYFEHNNSCFDRNRFIDACGIN